MVYYVIARDPKTHDEWVMPKTFDTILETAEYAEKCRTGDPRFRYRLEGKGDEEYTVTVGTNAAYAEPEHHTRDFTVTELFANQEVFVVDGSPFKECKECFALVKNRKEHTAWHNKLLP